MTDQSYDAIVVGSGIAGGWAAKELTERGLRVLMLDRGRMVRHREDYITENKAPYEMPFRGLGDRRSAHAEGRHRPRVAGNEFNRHFFADFRQHPYTTAEDRPFQWVRGDQVGGRSLVWGRQCYRFAPINFEENARDGHGVDWPIRYGDLEHWYDHVEQFIGISGTAIDFPTAPGGRFLQPAMPINPLERAIQTRLADRFPDRPITMGRSANITQQIGEDRFPCQMRSQCDRGCSYGAYFSTQSSTLPAAMATNRLTLMADSIVTRVLTDEAGQRATGVEVLDARTRETRTYSARIVFLCASALESVRLLLLSRSERHPDGLANSSGLVGKYIMDHFTSDAIFASTPAPPLPHIAGGRPAALWMPRFRNIGENQGEAYKRGYQCNLVVFADEWSRGARQLGIGVDLKRQLRRTGDWRVLLSAQCEMLPNVSNQVTLDGEMRDAWDQPVLQIDVGYGENDVMLRRAAGDDMLDMMTALDLGPVTRVPSESVPGSSVHEMGGAVMGRDRRTSVLDAHNRAHDIPNLFITDGAAMNSSSQSNPSFTYMAMTARATAFAAREFHARRL